MRAWEELLFSLEKQLGPETIAKWLRPIKVVRFDAANLYLEATPFQRSWFEEHIHPRVAHIFRNNNHRPIRIHWETQPDQKGGFSPQPKKNDILEPAFRLDSFLPLQPLAVEIAREITTTGKTTFNPVLFFGASGSGKTHLLMGIAAALKEKGVSACYLHADTFTGQVVQSIQIGQMQEFRKTLRSVDVLLVDAIDLFARKNTTQEEFFHTFNTLHTSGRQIILSASQAPHQLQEIEQRLISRFEWGIAIPLPLPTHEQLSSVLEAKMRFLGLSLSAEVLHFLLRRFRSSPKAPLTALHILALRLGSGKNPSLLQVEQLLVDQLEKEKERLLTPEKIIQETASHFGIRIEDLTGKSHMRTYVEPRKVALFLARTLLRMSFQKIGMLVHRDHSTVMTSIKDVEEACAKKEAPFFEAVEYLSNKLKTSSTIVTS